MSMPIDDCNFTFADDEFIAKINCITLSLIFYRPDNINIIYRYICTKSIKVIKPLLFNRIPAEPDAPIGGIEAFAVVIKTRLGIVVLCGEAEAEEVGEGARL